MPQHDAYVLHIWQSRALGGRQWVARLDYLSDGQRLRFANRDALLQHMQTLILVQEQHSGSDGVPPRGGAAEEEY